MPRAYATFLNISAAPVNLSSYLHKRPNSQNWQLRMMVPGYARAVVGKREFTRSLGTPDRRRAEQMAWPILAKWKAELTACAGTSDNPAKSSDAPYTPTREELDEVALSIAFERATERLPAFVTAKAKLGPEAFSNLVEAFDSRHSDAVRQLFAGNHSFWHDKARKEIARRGWILTEDSPDYIAFVENMARCSVDFFARAKATITGDGDGFTPSDSTAQLIATRAQLAKPGDGIIELYERYSTQRLSEGKQRKDTAEQGLVTVREFAEFVGARRSLRSIRQDDIRAWRNALASVPATYHKHKRYAGMTLRQAASAAMAASDRPISKLTVNKKMSTVSGFFRWARREGFADANPCDSLFYEADKRANPRPPFNAEQINSILKSPLFTGFDRDGKEFKRGNVKTRDWRFWIPLLCLFTGSRIGEVAQLKIADVKNNDGIWYIHIKHNSRSGQKTKSGKGHYVPIHSKLIKIGFVKFIEEQQKLIEFDDSSNLFPELDLNNRGQSAAASRFWRTYLQRIGLKSVGDGGDGLGAHSFRHGLADEFRLAGYLDREFAPILGHAGGTVTGGYGILREGTVSRLKSIVESAQFEGINFEHLFDN